VIASSYPFLDIFWSMCIFFLWVIWVAFLIFLLIDNFKRSDHSGVAKAGWTVLLLFLPVIGALIYIIARPPMAGEVAVP
jgi:Phospholipase_D-nuclease N-terminal